MNYKDMLHSYDADDLIAYCIKGRLPEDTWRDGYDLANFYLEHNALWNDDNYQTEQRHIVHQLDLYLQGCHYETD